jgi:hypothetical protein
MIWSQNNKRGITKIKITNTLKLAKSKSNEIYRTQT